MAISRCFGPKGDFCLKKDILAENLEFLVEQLFHHLEQKSGKSLRISAFLCVIFWMHFCVIFWMHFLPFFNCFP